jgi:hypothetical protein
MLALMNLCYDGVSSARFDSDLDAKQYVILLFERASGTLAGFSTLRLALESLAGKQVEVAYSGDTVIHPDHWGSKSLQSAFSRFLLMRKLRRPWRPVLWLLLSGGYKTYLIMVNHLPRSVPNRRSGASDEWAPFLKDLATRWFGSQYDAGRGIVRFSDAHYRVKTGVAPIDAETMRNADVAFFLERNPGHASGDELVCLAELRVSDLSRALTKSVLRQMGMSTRSHPERVGAEARP